MNSKMGDLRAYIRAFDHKITGKLAKEVKCFDLVPEIDVESIIEEEHLSASNNTDLEENW